MPEHPYAALIDAALTARRRAYARYSGFQVGAALLTATGEIFAGCNVENASYGLTQCAERVAIGAAVSAGHRQFVRLDIAASGGAPPCGACRQVLAEFSRDLPLLLVDAERPDVVTETCLAVLLPMQFELCQRDDPLDAST
jgi:cytidine deaminase